MFRCAYLVSSQKRLRGTLNRDQENNLARGNHNVGSSNLIKQILLDSKSLINPNMVRMGSLNIPHSPLDKVFKK